MNNTVVVVDIVEYLDSIVFSRYTHEHLGKNVDQKRTRGNSI